MSGRRPPTPPPDGPQPFDDAELEEYYRRIESATAAAESVRERRRRTRGGVSYPPPSCPTPEKIGYESLAAVTGAMLAVSAADRRSPDLRCYECRCGYWHLTSSKRW